jgi:MFS family permease
MFVRALQGTADLTKNTFKHWVYWLGCVFLVVICGYILASAVPVFSGLLGVIGALFCTGLCLQMPSCMWLYDRWGQRKTNKSWKFRLLVAWNVFQIIGGTLIMVAGVSGRCSLCPDLLLTYFVSQTWGSVIEIRDAYAANGGTKPFGCEDNSNSVKNE